jgi:hypothetical protein
MKDRMRHQGKLGVRNTPGVHPNLKIPTLRLRSGQAFWQATREMGHPTIVWKFVAAGPVSRILSAGLLPLDGHSSGPRIAAGL